MQNGVPFGKRIFTQTVQAHWLRHAPLRYGSAFAELLSARPPQADSRIQKECA